MSLLSSQGQSFGISNAYKITIRQARGSGGSASGNKNDVSTLAIPHGGYRLYEDGLPDDGGSQNEDGIVVTVTVNTKGTPPGKGTTATFKGVSCKCTESEVVNDAGKPVEGVATFTSDF